jgi:hypothetical protein
MYKKEEPPVLSLDITETLSAFHTIIALITQSVLITSASLPF